MKQKFHLLDLFCAAGGAGYGYHLAGFEVTGIDIEPQPRYPFRFIQADALTFPLDGFDAFHASPPCEHYTQMLNLDESYKKNHPDLIDRIRQRLMATGKPYIIENVLGARRYMRSPIMLCGAMFGLRVYRHRLFESNILLFQPHHPQHIARAAKAGKIPCQGEFWSAVGNFGAKADAQKAMGIDWMRTSGSKDREIAKAIPPAYTKWIGAQLLAYVEEESGA